MRLEIWANRAACGVVAYGPGSQKYPVWALCLNWRPVFLSGRYGGREFRWAY